MFRLDRFRIECRYDFRNFIRALGVPVALTTTLALIAATLSCTATLSFPRDRDGRFGREFRKSIGLHFDQIQTGAQSFVLKDARFVCLRGELNARTRFRTTCAPDTFAPFSSVTTPRMAPPFCANKLDEPISAMNDRKIVLFI